MSFAVGLCQALYVRQSDAVTEFNRGDSLEEILERHLLAVEAMSETETLTSVLLLSLDGKRLSHGAAPNLPQSYRDAIDGSLIGPTAGSCGTAAHFGHPVYVTDIATDELWVDYRHLALPHGLRSCWSTPIRSLDGHVIGTFAIYHRTIGGPTSEELAAIEMITKHVAQAIMRTRSDGGPHGDQWPSRDRTKLRLVADNSQDHGGPDRLGRILMNVDRLESLVKEIEKSASGLDSNSSETMNAFVNDSRKLADLIRQQIGKLAGPEL